MLGDSIKVSPVLDNSTDPEFSSYFTQGVWRDLFDFKNVVNASQGGDYFNLTRKNATQIHLKEGKVLPVQAANELTTGA